MNHKNLVAADNSSNEMQSILNETSTHCASFLVSEEEPEPRGQEPGGVQGRLPPEVALDAAHAVVERISLLPEGGGVLQEVVDAVLLAQRPEAQEEDPGHGGELDEAVLVLPRVGEEPQGPPWASGGGMRRRARERHRERGRRRSEESGG